MDTPTLPANHPAKVYVQMPAGMLLDPADKIIERFCKEWGIASSEVKGKRRKDHRAIMRQIICTHLKGLGYSLNFIGGKMNMNHTSVLKTIKESTKMLQMKESLFMQYYTPVAHLMNGNLN